MQRLAPTACIAGEWSPSLPPWGVILHGSRSGQDFTTDEEFHATVAYAEAGALDAAGDNLGWNATIGDGIVALHIDPKAWGWNAREASHQYLAVEFAQAKEGTSVSDAAVGAFCWWFVEIARAAWPQLPTVFPMHSELPAGIRDGKTDAFAKGDPRANELRVRIQAGLAALGH